MKTEKEKMDEYNLTHKPEYQISFENGEYGMKCTNCQTETKFPVVTTEWKCPKCGSDNISVKSAMDEMTVIITLILIILLLVYWFVF